MSAFIVLMPWTGEDTKDVFKKVIGGLIAAAVVAMGYALVEEMEWYFAAVLGTLLIMLVVLLVWRVARSTDRVEGRKTDEPSQVANPAIASHQPERSEAPPVVQEAVFEEPREQTVDHKSQKKIAKAEQKRRKKEAKAEKKREE